MAGFESGRRNGEIGGMTKTSLVEAGRAMKKVLLEAEEKRT